MAAVELNPVFSSVSGRIGGIVLYNSYGREYARIYVKPINPDTDAQRIIRKTFGDAVRSWQGLSPEEQYMYNKKARRLSISGYNHYISIYMKENLLYSDIKGKSLFAASSRHSSGLYKAGTSVYTASNPVYCSYSPAVQEIYSPGRV